MEFARPKGIFKRFFNRLSLLCGRMENTTTSCIEGYEVGGVNITVGNTGKRLYSGGEIGGEDRVEC